MKMKYLFVAIEHTGIVALAWLHVAHFFPPSSWSTDFKAAFASLSPSLLQSAEFARHRLACIHCTGLISDLKWCKLLMLLLHNVSI